MPERNITLDPSESGEVAFTYIPSVAKVYHVSVDGLTGSFEAISPYATHEEIDNYYNSLVDWATSCLDAGFTGSVLLASLHQSSSIAWLREQGPYGNAKADALVSWLSGQG